MIFGIINTITQTVITYTHYLQNILMAGGVNRLQSGKRSTVTLAVYTHIQGVSNIRVNMEYYF